MDAQQILQEARQIEEQIRADRRYLHSHPETGFDLHDTVAFVKARLAEMGYTPQDCGKAGVVALAGSKKPGKVFLLRGDMDALPLQEEAEVAFAAANGKMHACGHDLHTAMLLGAAKLLKMHEDEIQGTVKLMFQPAEEIFAGAQDMIEAGVLKMPDVDGAMMFHVMAAMPVTAGTMIVQSAGISNPAADYFEIRVQGKGCHGSMPQAGVDPISAAAHILLALQELHARELGVADQAVLTVGVFQAGTVANVIPDTAVLCGTIRTYGEAMRQFLKTRMAEIVRHTAAAFRAEAEVIWGGGCPAFYNDGALSDNVHRYMGELLGSQAVLFAQDPQTGAKVSASEDFAYISQQVPTVMVAVAAGSPETGYCYPQHHPKVKFDERVLADGCAAYAYSAMRWLEEQQ